MFLGNTTKAVSVPTDLSDKGKLVRSCTVALETGWTHQASSPATARASIANLWSSIIPAHTKNLPVTPTIPALTQNRGWGVPMMAISPKQSARTHSVESSEAVRYKLAAVDCPTFNFELSTVNLELSTSNAPAHEHSCPLPLGKSVPVTLSQWPGPMSLPGFPARTTMLLARPLTTVFLEISGRQP